MTKFAAETVQEFVKKAYKKFGDKTLGETKHHAGYKDFKFKDGKIIGFEFVCPLELDYAEVGGGKPNSSHKEAIAEIARLAEEHELKHQQYYLSTFKAWNPKKAAQELMSQTFKDEAAIYKAANEKLADLLEKLLASCYKLHAKEGVIVFTPQGDGSIKVTQKAAGRSGCR